MGNLIMMLISTIIISISAIMIYDARIVAKKMFSSNETNETSKTLKIVGFIIFIIGLCIIYMLKR